MKLHRLDYRQALPTTPEVAWRFFSDPRNLAKITPPWLDFRIISEPPPAIYEGLMIHYRIRPLPRVSWKWVTEITTVDEPRCFVDEQRSGPYRYWRHQHDFMEIYEGILMTDRLEYALPFGIFGDFAHRPVVRPRLEEIFTYRRKVLQRLFSGEQEVIRAGSKKKESGNRHEVR